MYQYSLEWFIGIFLNSIANADASGTPRELLFIAIALYVLFNPSLWPESHWPTFFWCVIYNLGKKFSGHRLSYCLRNPCPSTMLFGESILQARNAGYSCGGKDGALVRALASLIIVAWFKCVGWVCCSFLSLAPRVFFLRFSPLLKNQHFQIPIRPGIRWTKNHFVDVLPLNRYYLKKCVLFECQCIQHGNTNWGHYFYVSSFWRRDRHFT